MSTAVTLMVEGPVARICFASDTKVNLLSRAVREQLARHIELLAENEDVSVVVFQAEGPTFLGGADIRELKELDPASALEDSRHGQALMNRIAALPATTLAAIHAACAGGGCELALACDLRLAAERSRIGLPETSIGVLPGWGGSVRAVRLLGGATARRLILTGELLPATEALRIGLVDAVFPNDAFGRGVDGWIERILTRAPLARKTAKRLIRQLEADDWESAFRAEARAFASCYTTGEAAEGLSAFLENRPAAWHPSRDTQGAVAPPGGTEPPPQQH